MGTHRNVVRCTIDGRGDIFSAAYQGFQSVVEMCGLRVPIPLCASGFPFAGVGVSPGSLPGADAMKAPDILTLVVDALIVVNFFIGAFAALAGHVNTVELTGLFFLAIVALRSGK